MELLFQTSIMEKGESLVFDVYEFRLNRGTYKAILQSKKASNEMILWKDKGGWIARFRKNDHIAKAIGQRIDEFKK